MESEIGTAEITEVLSDSGTAHVRVSGEIDVASVASVTDRVAELLDRGVKSIEVDLSAVTFMDSSGLNGLVRMGTRAQEQQCELVVVDPSARVYRAMEITGVDQVLTIRRTGAEG